MMVLRSALRGVLSGAGISVSSALILALGIGATTAIFSLIHAVLLQSLPYPTPERLVQVYETVPDGGRNAVSGGAFKDWFELSGSFSALAVYADVQQNFSGASDPETVKGLEVSQQFLEVLGLSPRIGRDFVAGEDQASASADQIILSHRLWQRRHAGDGDILGQQVSVDQRPHTVIGVLDPRSALPGDADYLIPTRIDGDPDQWQRSGHWRSVIGRLATGVSAQAAEAELRALKQRLNPEYPVFKQSWDLAVVPLQEALAGDVQPMLYLLLAASGFVLLIACANVSNLLLGRAAARSRELALRSALGAARSALVGQLLCESLILALSGCVGGVLFALVGIEVLVWMTRDMLPGLMHPQLHGSVLLFSLLLACASGLLSGLLPALRASRPDLNVELKQGERGSTSVRQQRARSLLLVAQFAFTLVLLVGAGLLLRSFATLLATDPGFEVEQRVAFDVSFSTAGYPEAERRQQQIDQIRERLAALPGVSSVAAASSLPLSRSGPSEFVSRADQEARTDYVVGTDFVSGDLLSALGIGLQRGRALQELDNQSGAERVLLINRRLADDLYPGEDPVGHSLRLLGQQWRIVGVVDSVRHYVLHMPAPPRIYAPQHFSNEAASFLLRAEGDTPGLIEAARRAVLEVDPQQPISRPRSMQQDLDRALSIQRILLWLVGAFASVALTLACVGIYAVVAYSVALRERELGIRAALGASRRQLLRTVLRSGLRPSLLGIALGCGIALMLGQLMQGLLYEVEGTDPSILVGAVVLLGSLAVATIYWPARRASKALPMSALRAE